MLEGHRRVSAVGVGQGLEVVSGEQSRPVCLSHMRVFASYMSIYASQIRTWTSRTRIRAAHTSIGHQHLPS